MNIHPDDLLNLEKARTLATRLAASIGKTCTLEPKRRPLGMTATGLCYVAEKRIAIIFRFKQHAGDGGKWWNKPLSWTEIAETVAHEVAHLVHPNHSKGFRELEKQLISQI